MHWKGINMKKQYVIVLLLIAVALSSTFTYLVFAENNVKQYDKEINNNYNSEVDLEIINEKEKDVNYMYGVATAYTPSAGGINSDNNPEITATGEPAKNGVIAVNPNVIPYGSEVMIIHNNTVIRGQAQDTGGAMRQNPNQVDILMENHQRALEWGRKEVHIIWW